MNYDSDSDADLYSDDENKLLTERNLTESLANRATMYRVQQSAIGSLLINLKPLFFYTPKDPSILLKTSTQFFIKPVGDACGKNKYEMNNQVLESTEEENDLGVMITDSLKSIRNCHVAYMKAHRVLGMIRRTISYKSVSILLPLCKTCQTTSPVLHACMVATLHLRQDIVEESPASFHQNDTWTETA